MVNVIKKNLVNVEDQKKTLDDLPTGWGAKILKLAQEGASEVEWRVKLSISQDLYYRLLKEEDEFSITIKKAKEICEAWWLKQGRMNLKESKFQTVLWYMNMKNRFGWRDKSTEEVKDEAKSLAALILGATNVAKNSKQGK